MYILSVSLVAVVEHLEGPGDVPAVDCTPARTLASVTARVSGSGSRTWLRTCSRTCSFSGMREVAGLRERSSTRRCVTAWTMRRLSVYYYYYYY